MPTLTCLVQLFNDHYGSTLFGEQSIEVRYRRRFYIRSVYLSLIENLNFEFFFKKVRVQTFRFKERQNIFQNRNMQAGNQLLMSYQTIRSDEMIDRLSHTF